MDFKEIQEYLKSPKEKEETFWESNVLIWIDWREFEESIIEYFNSKLPDEDKIEFECIEIDKKRGIDIVLNKNGKKIAIPYADEYTDRDTTIKSIQSYLKPKYQIRWYMESLGSDTLAFALLETEKWIELEKEFGKTIVEYYFAEINDDSLMFEMDMNMIFDLLDKREVEKQ